MIEIDSTSPRITEAVSFISDVAKQAGNEEQLKIQLEERLHSLCDELGISWNPYTYEMSFESGRYRLDAVHGATVIEYEPPRSFHGDTNSQLIHARRQAEDYTNLLASEEGRLRSRYSLVVWDGETISFGLARDGEFDWEPPRPFDSASLVRLLELIDSGGKPLVSPLVLKQLVGPDTRIGRLLIPLLYSAVVDSVASSGTNMTKLIYTEWARLFGQVDGESTERLSNYLEGVSRSHGIDYSGHPQAYIFALNTYIAIVAKICAAAALTWDKPTSSIDATNPKAFLEELESGRVFKLHGIQNMLSTDFFSWYLRDGAVERFRRPLEELLDRLRDIDFDTRRKDPSSVRDLFKGLYMGFTPAPMRHALGEYYTPDWLASHVLDAAGWDCWDTLLDPTCGSGTFILEALRRRLADASTVTTAKELLDGLHGIDLNPLAVLTTRASLVVYLADRFDPRQEVFLPVFLADAINTAEPIDGAFRHTILTEKGERTFAIPVSMAGAPDFYVAMDQLRVCIDAGLDRDQAMASVEAMAPSARLLDTSERATLSKTVDNLIDLHRNHWNGIWCLILFDRIEAGCIHDIDLVAGNPPWVKWSNLPRKYAEFIKPLCERLDIFSEDAWVGGIQSDISTVVTYHALERFVRKGGSLAFLITGTVFKNESSQGFRRWKIDHLSDGYSEPVQVEFIEDYGELRPFEGVANWPTLLVVRRNGEATHYPLPVRVYRKPKGSFNPNDYEKRFAIPIPGTTDGPWLIGQEQDTKLWPMLFDAKASAHYVARKGVTTDANGIFFVKAEPSPTDDLIRITNDPGNGRRRGISIKTQDVEPSHVFPLLRGKDVRRFRIASPVDECIIVPQHGMFGDENLPSADPRLFNYLSAFKDILLQRSSYRRFQKGKPFWSVWSTGEYTFAPFKVVWKEMSGHSFVAAYVSTGTVAGRFEKTIVPDHKVYFVPLESEAEAAYLCGFLNARVVAQSISSYASSLSLGTSVVEYLKIPPYDPASSSARELSRTSKALHDGASPSDDIEQQLDRLVLQIIQQAKETR